MKPCSLRKVKKLTVDPERFTISKAFPPIARITGLRIDGIDFLVRKAAERKVVIQSDIYVTNFGAQASQDYQFMLKATDIDSKLVADKQWSNTGLIAPDETAIRSVNLTVPDRYNYVVDVLIWSNSTIVGQGQDYVAAQCNDKAE